MDKFDKIISHISYNVKISERHNSKINSDFKKFILQIPMLNWTFETAEFKTSINRADVLGMLMFIKLPRASWGLAYFDDFITNDYFFNFSRWGWRYKLVSSYDLKPPLAVRQISVIGRQQANKMCVGSICLQGVLRPTGIILSDTLHYQNFFRFRKLFMLYLVNFRFKKSNKTQARNISRHYPNQT